MPRTPSARLRCGARLSLQCMPFAFSTGSPSPHLPRRWGGAMLRAQTACPALAPSLPAIILVTIMRGFCCSMMPRNTPLFCGWFCHLVAMGSALKAHSHICRLAGCKRLLHMAAAAIGTSAVRRNNFQLPSATQRRRHKLTTQPTCITPFRSNNDGCSPPSGAALAPIAPPPAIRMSQFARNSLGCGHGVGGGSKKGDWRPANGTRWRNSPQPVGCQGTTAPRVLVTRQTIRQARRECSALCRRAHSIAPKPPAG